MDFLEEDEFNERFRDRLVTIRNELKWSQQKMADNLGIQRETYKKYEYRSAFPLYLLPRLIAATEQPYSYWIYGQGKSTGHVRVLKR